LFCSICFLSRFWAFRNNSGVQKRDKKKSRENLLSFQKKYPGSYLLTSLFFFLRPLGALAHLKLITCLVPCAYVLYDSSARALNRPPCLRSLQIHYPKSAIRKAPNPPQAPTPPSPAV
jgi:hypothetical protein